MIFKKYILLGFEFYLSTEFRLVLDYIILLCRYIILMCYIVK